MTLMDEERTCPHKISGLKFGVGIVEKLARVRGSGKEGNLEDKRDALGRDRGGTTVGRNSCHCCLILLSTIIVDQAISRGLDGGQNTQ